MPVLIGSQRPSYVLAAVGAIVVGVLAIGGLTNELADKNAPLRPRDRHARLYAALVSSDFEGLARHAELTFTEAHGATPQQQDSVFAVYATFGSAPVRRRIAYQIGGASSPSAPVCSRDDLGWECFRHVDDVVVEGESYCVATNCTTSRRDAMTLLELGVRHLADVRAKRDT